MNAEPTRIKNKNLGFISGNPLGARKAVAGDLMNRLSVRPARCVEQQFPLQFRRAKTEQTVRDASLFASPGQSTADGALKVQQIGLYRAVTRHGCKCCLRSHPDTIPWAWRRAGGIYQWLLGGPWGRQADGGKPEKPPSRRPLRGRRPANVPDVGKVSGSPGRGHLAMDRSCTRVHKVPCNGIPAACVGLEDVYQRMLGGPRCRQAGSGATPTASLTGEKEKRSCRLGHLVVNAGYFVHGSVAVGCAPQYQGPTLICKELKKASLALVLPALRLYRAMLSTVLLPPSVPLNVFVAPLALSTVRSV